MVNIIEHKIGRDRWLRLNGDGVPLLGAYANVDEPVTHGFTVMWFGLPRAHHLISFCKHVPKALLGNDTGKLSRRGRAFLSGNIVADDGENWLAPAHLPGVSLLRFECSLRKNDYGVQAEASNSAREAIVWADMSSSSIITTDDAIENVGVKMGLDSFHALHEELSRLVKDTYFSNISLDAARIAIGELTDYLSYDQGLYLGA